MSIIHNGTRLYISGGMSNLIGHNFPAFHAAADRLILAGFDVIDPATLDEDTDTTDWEWEDYIRRDLRILAGDDILGVAVLDNWQLSRGAVEEVHLAHVLRLPVLTVDQWICEWVGHLSRETVIQ